MPEFLIIVVIFLAGAPGHKATLAQQGQCADRARKAFLDDKEEWTPDSNMSIFGHNYTSHYNVDLNTCFIRIQLQGMFKKDKNSFTRIDVLDAFEGTSYGSYTVAWPDPKGEEEVLGSSPCYLYDRTPTEPEGLRVGRRI